MINLSVNTKLKAGKTLDRCYQYFVEDQKLALKEWIVHLHAEKGACELRVTGEKIKGSGETNSKAVLLTETERLTKEYGFKPLYYGLHLHTVPNEEMGHLMISVKDTDPVEISFESQELDYLVKQFSSRLPKAK